MNKYRAYIYNIIPKQFRKSLGRSKLLKPLRDYFFRNKQGFRELQVPIHKSYGDYKTSFTFVSSIQIATKAKERGIETKVLNNTLTLLKQQKPRQIDDYVIADIGANFGFLSLIWAQTVAARGRVFSFEPHPKVYAAFNKSVTINKLDAVISAHNLAVGKKLGSIDVLLANTTSNTKKSEIAGGQIRGSVTVEMNTIDNFFKNKERLDLLKIDVDGIELDILKGAKNTLNRLKPILVVETNGDYAIYKFLQEQNYSILNMKLQHYDPKEVLPLNIFCIPN